MKTSTLDFRFVSARPLGQKRGPVRGYVILKDYSVDDDKTPLVTAEAVGIAEFEASLDQLENELKEIRKRARKSFARYKV